MTGTSVFSDNTAFIKLSFSEAAEQCGKVNQGVNPVLFYTHAEEFYRIFVGSQIVLGFCITW